MIIGVITLWLICGFVGALVGLAKGRVALGFFIGLLLGPLGCILLLFESGPRIAGSLIFGGFILAGLFIAGIASYAGFQYYHHNQEAQTEAAATDVPDIYDTSPSSPSAEQPTSDPDPAPAADDEASSAPAPPQNPTTEEVAAQQARANARQALEIARKYGSH